MVTIKRFEAEDAAAWNAAVREAKNGVFLFDRAYMDYHADRFADHSLTFYKGDELLALLPANEANGELVSHGGLTFGGLVLSRRATVSFVLEAFDALKVYSREAGLSSLVYKRIPYIYTTQPAEEDLYALFRHEAQLYRRDVSSVIDLTAAKPSYTKGTKYNLSKARKAGIRVEVSTDYATFMRIEEEILRSKYGTAPTHTLEEIELLANRFPENIQLRLAYRDDECLGGTILYLTSRVVHTQYIGITDEGKEIGALDSIVDGILTEQAAGRAWFSFGISTTEGGRVLNEGLIRNKESFGARAVVYDFYKLKFT